MEVHAPQAIVLALGAGALGGPDALRLLLQFAGRSPVVDVAISVVFISLVTALVLGTTLLVRFVRKAGAAAGGGEMATDLFAQMTAVFSVGAAFLVTACLLLVVPGGLDSVRLPIDFAVKNPIVSVVVICTAAAAAVATGFLPCCTVPLPRFFRRAGSASADGPAPAALATTVKAVFLVAMSLVVASLLVAYFVVSGGFGAPQLLFPGFYWRRPITDMTVGVGIVTVAGTTLLLWCSRRARTAAVSGGAAAPTS